MLALPEGQHAALVLEVRVRVRVKVRVRVTDPNSDPNPNQDDVRFLRGWRPTLEAHVRQMEQAHAGGPGAAWDVFYLDCAHGSGWDFNLRGLQSASHVVRRRRAHPCATAPPP